MSPISRRAVAMAVLMTLVAVFSPLLAPSKLLADQRPELNLEKAIPKTIGAWRESAGASGVVDPQAGALVEKLYSQIVARSYVAPDGYRIMLSIAYGRDQRGSLQLHYPEVCYPSVGFQISSNKKDFLNIPGYQLPVRKLEAFAPGGRHEPITYWTLVGDFPNLGGLQKKSIESSYALKGLVPDGVIIRVSSIDSDSGGAFSRQQMFLNELFNQASPELRLRLFGTPAER